ncbi:hypothetical protein P692DRAFT_20233595 [Suillus brevipes Sb2]|nr:hypothetical protein P692DRAFT_20233595 [Suillus brevipes Sb2]
MPLRRVCNTISLDQRGVDRPYRAYHKSRELHCRSKVDLVGARLIAHGSVSKRYETKFEILPMRSDDILKIVVLEYRVRRRYMGRGLMEDMDNVRPPTIVQNRVPRRVSFENLDSAGIGCKAVLFVSRMRCSSLLFTYWCLAFCRYILLPNWLLCVLDRHEYGSC